MHVAMEMNGAFMEAIPFKKWGLCVLRSVAGDIVCPELFSALGVLSCLTLIVLEPCECSF